jgi:hypothetical protein
VDLVLGEAPDALPERRTDVPVDHARGEVVLVEPGDVIRRFPTHVATIRLLGVGEGGERSIGEYTVCHTRWPGT